MARIISVYRRRPHLVDLFIRNPPGNMRRYGFLVASNFDAAASTFQDVPSTGYKSPKVPDDQGFNDSQFRDCTRFRFDPADYQSSFPALNDSKPFFLAVSSVDYSGQNIPASAYHLVLPYSSQPQRTILLNGTASAAVDLDHSQEIQLPMQCNCWEFQVNTGNSLAIAFEPTGPEYIVPPLATYQINLSKVYPSISQIFIRGSGGSSSFNAVLTERNNPNL